MKSLLLAVVCAPLLLADTYPRQPDVDAQHYIFRVTLSDASSEIQGETTAALKFVKDGVTEASLDLTSAANGKGMTVTAVSSDAGAVRYQHEADRLRMTFPAAKTGEIRRFTVTYHGTPGGGLKSLANKFGDRVFFSVNWPDMAHQWLPTIDHPYDKATSEFIVTAPDKYQVVANGLLVEQIDLGDGRRTTHWKQSVPIATWLDNIGVAQFSARNFAHAAGVPLQSWLFYQDRDPGIATFEEPLRKAIEFYNDRIGPYPYEKLAAVEAAGMGGGMEHASEIFFGERGVSGRPALGLVAHETAHQWFGDSVTESDWDDVWLSEGFATYFALLTSEYYEGREAFVAGLKRGRTAVIAAEGRLPGVAVVQDKPWKGIPNQIVYQKGGWVLHQLRGQVGTERFWAGIREYYRRFRDGNASTAGFRKVMEEVSGQDLGWFFQQWLYRAGSPSLEGGWKYNPAGRKIEIDLAQTEAGDAFRLSLEVAVAADAGTSPKIETIQMTAKRQHFEIACDREPASVELDPNTWLLAQTKFARQ
jgi:aminopeptidase N